ncbi:MAG: hypothetical protein LUH10_17915 [Tannerellaceae bacterium]|nr:hypothetical protein [Tannerellaceae bacterium]
MIYKSFIYTVLILLLLPACTGNKIRQTEEPIPQITEEEPELVPIAPADNFLCGNRYSIGSKYNAQNRPVGDQWKLVNHKVFEKDIYRYGTTITFQDSVHYHISYAAPCGNDCFFNSYGKYQLFVDDQLILTEDSVRLYGDCFGTDSAGIYTQQLFQITYPEDDSMRLQFNKIR